MTITKPGGFSRAHTADLGEELVRCVCRPNCGNYCAHDVRVRDGKVVQTQQAPMPNERYSRVCLRGLSNLQRVYDPDRILYPMKRVGERGEGGWARISWDEAIRRITDNWKETQAKFGKQALAFAGGSGNYAGIHGGIMGMPTRLANVLEATTINHSVDAAVQHGEAEVAGPIPMLPTNSGEDLVNAKTIVILGYNPTEAKINEWHFFQDARDAGAKIITIDPVYTNTAANSDEFVSIRVGGDPALLMSWVYCVLRDGRENTEFLKTKTVAPYLVRADTGTFLRMSDIGVADDDRAVVLDSTGKPGAAGEISDPSMEGRHTVKGIQVTNALELLREHVEQYRPELAAELTDIPAARIEELYEELISGPTTIRSGYGGQALNNGHMVGKALMTWASVTGMIGLPGADVGTNWEYYGGTNFAWTMPTGTAATFLESMTLQDIVKDQEFKGESFPLKSIYFYQGNWMGNIVDQNGFKRNVLDNLDFIVSVDLVWTDTARYSDIVLPAAHFYEYSDMILAMSAQPFIQFSDKAIDPPGEAKPDGDIIRLLAEAMGVDEHFRESDEDYMRQMIDSDVSRSLGVTLERLKEEHAIRVKPKDGLNFGGDQTFPSSDGRLHFYMEDPKPRFDYGQEVPVERERMATFYPPTEAWTGTEAQKKYPLILLSARPRHRVHSMWFGQKWLRELDPEPTLKIHPDDAKPRGIKDGDYVEAYNDRGHAVAKAVVTQGIQPGSLTYPKGWQRHQHIAGSFSELNSTANDPVGVNSSFFDATCEVRVWKDEK